MVGTWSKPVRDHLYTGATSGAQAPMSPETSLLRPRQAYMQKGVDFCSKIDFLTILVLIIEIFIFQFLNDHKAHILKIYIFYPYLPIISFL